MPDPIKPTQADIERAAQFLSESDGDFTELSELFALHAQHAREQALEEAATYVEGDDPSPFHKYYAAAIRDLKEPKP